MVSRRTFLASSGAGALAASAAPQPAAADIPRAKWIENGIIDAGGSHEPYSFVIRRGGYRLDARETYERNQSEEVIKALKEQGVEVFHTHFYKGAGMAHEKAEMEDAKRVAAIAHRHGMKVDSYLQWNTMVYEPFFAEEPRAQKWIQRDILGQPILLRYGYQQSYRYRPCFANREYLDYLKKIVRYAVEEVKTDFIHFDNYDLNPEPESCHCEWCVKGFRQFIRNKYTDAQLMERFGFTVVDYVNPPQWNPPHPPSRLQIIFDPAIQEWIDYRCQLMADALRDMAVLAKSINPEVVIEVNPHGITGGNRTWVAGLDHSRFLKYTQVFWTEERNEPALHSDGRLTSKIRSYKLARRYNNILFTYIAGDEAAMAEGLSFNQTLGYAGNHPIGQQMRQYIDFYRANRELFQGTKDLATVAMLRSYPSITYNHQRAQLSAVLTEQALIQARIPFEYVFDEHLADLSKYAVLILPDSECLSDQQVAYVRDFVEGGGGLIASGLAGVYDQWRRLRVKPGLAGLIDNQPAARGYEENVERMQLSGAGTRKAFGKGRVAYFPAIQFDGPMPEIESFFNIGSKWWKRPKNAAELVDAIRWGANGRIPVEISGPEFLVANVVEQPDQKRWAVHLVNYNREAVPAIPSVQVTCRPEGAARIKQVTLYSPAFDKPRAAQVAGGNRFTVPEVRTYVMASIEWA